VGIDSRKIKNGAEGTVDTDSYPSEWTVNLISSVKRFRMSAKF